MVFFMIRDDPSRSELIRPGRTGGPSWSGPTFVPAWMPPYPLVGSRLRVRISPPLENPLRGPCTVDKDLTSTYQQIVKSTVINNQ